MRGPGDEQHAARPGGGAALPHNQTVAGIIAELAHQQEQALRNLGPIQALGKVNQFDRVQGGGPLVAGTFEQGPLPSGKWVIFGAVSFSVAVAIDSTLMPDATALRSAGVVSAACMSANAGDQCFYTGLIAETRTFSFHFGNLVSWVDAPTSWTVTLGATGPPGLTGVGGFTAFRFGDA